MLILAINTASKNTSIALLNEDKKAIDLIKEDSWLSNNDEAEHLMPKINDLLEKSGKNFSQIEKVVVVKGPGSFTGLRVGITVANMISYLNKCSLYEINTFKYWWTAFEKFKPALHSALLIYAGSKGVYVNKRREDSAEIINLFELADYLKNKKIKNVFGEISSEQKQEIISLNFINIEQSFGEIIASAISKGLKSVNIVNPLYIKSPSITKPKLKCPYI